jgi:lipopolysaccharide biosynthesis glycosyltransferase
MEKTSGEERGIMKVNVVIAADRNYLYPALVLLANLTERGVWLDDNVKLWFLAAKNELSEGDKDLITCTVETLASGENFEFAEIDLSKMPETHGYLSKTALVRLLLPEFLIGQNWIWIDVDAVLCTSWGEIVEAFFPHIRKASLVAAKCHQVDAVRQEASGNPIGSYFNSGVISWQSNSLEKGLGNKYLKALDQFVSRGIVGDDQDAMNAVHAGQVHLINGDFNAFGDYLFKHQDRNQVKISHFAGATKPWHLTLAAQSLCRNEWDCPWQPFFKSDSFLFSKFQISSPQRLGQLRSVRRRAHLSGHPDWRVVWFARVVAMLPLFIKNLKMFNDLRSRNYAHPLHSTLKHH